MPEDTRLADVVAPVNEKIGSNKDQNLPYVGLEHVPSRGSTLLGTESATASISTNSVFQRGDVLFGKLRPNLRKALSAPFEGYCSTDILVLRAKDGVNARFAGWLFRSENVGAAAERTAIGTKMPRTSWGLLKDEKVFVPPNPEQDLIAHILDTLDAQIRRTEALIAKLEQIKQGLLTDLLTRGVDENGQLRPPPDEAPELYTESPIGRIPKDWNSAPLARLIEDAYRYPSYYGIEYVQDGIPEVRGELIGRDGVLESDRTMYRCISGETAARYPKVRLRTDDLILSVRGTLGKCARVPDWLEGAVITANLLKLTPTRDVANPQWLLTVLRHSSFQERLDAVSSSTTIKTIQVPELLSIPLGIPPAWEQAEISSRVDAAARRLAKERAYATSLENLKRGLMDDLLTGRVRVTALLDTPARETG